MAEPKTGRQRQGEPSGGGELPPVGLRRWVARRKAQVVAAVRQGRLTAEEACRRYDLSPEELAAWQRAVHRHGMAALRVTRLQEFRRRPQPSRVAPAAATGCVVDHTQAD